MKRLTFLLGILCLFSCKEQTVEETSSSNAKAHYLQNRAPLTSKPYLELPLGSIQAEGWLLDQLQRMKTGMTGNLDEIYPEVMGKRNGWLGGDGDGWERGPYWIDGLLPLAYLLDDDSLKAKVQPWIEWTLNNQTEEGYLGPTPFEEEPDYEAGLQRGMRKDWWPKMVMLKVLKQYYEATGDERVIEALTKYFRYQLNELPDTPLDNWTLWANRRGGDNLMVVYWLYNITGDEFLLELGDLIAEQTFPWTEVFLNESGEAPNDPWHYNKLKRYPFDSAEIAALSVSQQGSMHCVNFAQGLKQPAVYYQRTGDQRYLQAVHQALHDMEKHHGQPQGMYGGDEPLHGKNPVQGVEFCSVAEEMFSLETMLTITGDMSFADRLEKITYNALPAQASDDFSSRQYFQAANQVQLTDQMQVSYQTVGHKGTDFVFGTLSGYPCCTSNMHQSWPKYVQNLWYATADGGVAALLYAPSSVSLKVADGINLQVKEETGYPFRDEVKFTLNPEKEARFPFHLRVPAWAEAAQISINGEAWEGKISEQIAVIERSWQAGDEVVLKLPMELRTSQWYEFSRAVERGPLVYALKIRDRQQTKDRGDKYRAFQEVYPLDDWNFALLKEDLQNISESYEVVEKDWKGEYPWNLENAPVEIKARGVQLPEWQLTQGAPHFPAWWGGRTGEEVEVQEITLVPYGCTTLRITEFPVYGLY
jgi:DUF1680 family protein